MVMNMNLKVLALFCLAASVSSLSVEDRLEQVETQLNAELGKLRRDNALLKTELSDLKRDQDSNKQKIKDLVQSIQPKEVRDDDETTSANDASTDEDSGTTEAENNEISELKSQVESLRNDLVETRTQLEELNQKVEGYQATCCNSGTTTAQEDDSVDIGTDWGRVAVFANQSLIATGHKNGVKIFNICTNQFVRTLGTDDAWDLKPFKTNQLLQATNLGEIKIWNVESGQLIHTAYGHSGKTIESIALNKNQTRMISGGWDNDVILWDTASFDHLKVFVGHSRSVFSVIFNEPKNQVISGSGDRSIRVWNINTGSLTRLLTGHSDWVFRLLLDEETGLLYSSSQDNTIKVWHVDSGTNLETFKARTNNINALMFSDDKQRLISASQDKSIISMNKHSGEVVRRLEYTSELYTLIKNPLNGRLLSTTGDKKLVFWPKYLVL